MRHGPLVIRDLLSSSIVCTRAYPLITWSLAADSRASVRGGLVPYSYCLSVTIPIFDRIFITLRECIPDDALERLSYTNCGDM